MASIVEREAKDLVDMRHVAGILLNRLKLTWPCKQMQRCNTLGVMTRSPRVGGATKRSDKTNPSLYNTYLYSGLPPAPIANPDTMPF